ncbi:hypothetical protein [Afipia sp. Root123D2]|uniref:hypothetical protein n=1 Tax=Afipia sp. Root123D2 TaxID=1736436 RepID=UPI000AEA83CA|nr:hypothetical protein [Afipia sp. Root123D2]
MTISGDLGKFDPRWRRPDVNNQDRARRDTELRFNFLIQQNNIALTADRWQNRHNDQDQRHGATSKSCFTSQ